MRAPSFVVALAVTATAVTAVIAAPAGVAAAEPVHPTGGLALGVLAIPNEDDSFAGPLVTGHVGIVVGRGWSVHARLSLARDTVTDPFDPITYDITYAHAIPSLRWRHRWAWIEGGYGGLERWRSASDGRSTRLRDRIGEVVVGVRPGAERPGLDLELSFGVVVVPDRALWFAVGAAL